MQIITKNFWRKLKQYAKKMWTFCKKKRDWATSSIKKWQEDSLLKTSRTIRSVRLWVTRFFIVRTKELEETIIPIFRRICLASLPSALALYLACNDSLGIHQLLQDKDEIIWNYLFSAAGMFGASVAIVFTLSTFSLQKAAEMYSSRYFEIYAFKKEEKAIYSTVSIFIVLFFGLGFWFKTLPVNADLDIALGVIYASLLVVVLVLSLVIQYFQIVIKKVNPLNGLKFVYEQSQGDYKKANKDVERAYKVIKIYEPKITKVIVTGKVFKTYRTRIEKNLESVFEITMKLAEKLESESTKEGFNIFRKMLLDFFDFRSGSLLLHSSADDILALQTDGDNFLAQNLERLKLAGEKFINENQISNARLILEIFRDLAKKVSQLKFMNASPLMGNENPPFGLIVAYLKELTHFAAKSENLEITYKSSQIWREILQIAVEADLQLNIQLIEDYTYPLAAASSLKQDTNFIAKHYLKGYVDTINLTIKNKKGSPRQISRNFSLIGQLLALTSKHDSMNTDDPIFTLARTVDQFPKFFKEQANAEEKRRAKAIILQYIEGQYSFLRELAKGVDMHLGIFPAATSDLLESTYLVLKKLHQTAGFKDVKGEIEEWIVKYSYLSAKFIELSKSKDLTGNFHHILDLPVTCLLINLDTPFEDKLFSSTLETAFQVAKYLIEKDFTDGFYKSRDAMLEIIKIGVIALKRGKLEVVEDVKRKIEEFEEIFKKKYNPPEGALDHLSLQDKTVGWRRDINRTPSFLNLGDRLLHETVTYDDISKFILEVWNVEVTVRESFPFLPPS